MNSLSTILLISYIVTGVSLIGTALFKKVKIYEGEKIEKFTQFKVVTKITNILFGLIVLYLAYLYYNKAVNVWVLLGSIILIEILQRVINGIYIKSDNEGENEMIGTTSLAEEIRLDEILEEDFFERNRGKSTFELEEEISKRHIEQLEYSKKDKNRRRINELIAEGIKLGVLSYKNNEKYVENNLNIESVFPIEEVLKDKYVEENKGGEVVHVDFSK